MQNQYSILFGGEVFDGRDAEHPLITLRDGSTAIVRVREMPARHHLELLELFHIGRESDLIQRCSEIGTPIEGGAIGWRPLFTFPAANSDPEAAKRAIAEAAATNLAGRDFVDGLADESHLVLADACQRLNFQRAIATAQRQIARGQTLGPLMETIASQVLQPMRKELGSWMQSLTTEISSALAAKPPSGKPSPG
jgi:hypothetical protein